MVNKYSVGISSADAGNQSQRQGLLDNASLRVGNILYQSIFLSQNQQQAVKLRCRALLNMTQGFHLHR